MSQDTRRDKRAKTVSLNVRYKSATVDEFIENHSHDVSKGGIFVKTPTPFSPGTLLKFEIRLAADKPVIAGVGRVVWKREPAQASAERPAGMGVKFIKIDEASRLVIDRLVQKGEGAGSAYASEADAIDTTAVTLQRPAAAASGPPPAGMPTPKGIQAPLGAPAPVVPRPQAAPYTYKQTKMGIGPVSSPPPGASSPPAAAASSPPAAAAASPPASTAKPAEGVVPPAPKTDRMFPDTPPESDSERPNERTVMKQAAELLEEALKEAGGSMEEVGMNPLFDQRAHRKSRPPIEEPHPADQEKTSGGTVIMASRPLSSPPPAEASARPPGASAPPAAASTPPVRPSVSSQPPAGAQPPASARPGSLRPPILERQTQRSSNAGLFVALALVLVVGGGAVAAWQVGLFGGSTGEKPTPTGKPSATASVSALPSTTASTAVLATPGADAATAAGPGDAAAAADAAVAAVAVADAGTADAKATAAATTATATATATATTAITTATTRPTATATSTPTATATVTTTPTATATATTAATSTATATAAATATATTTATATSTATAADTSDTPPPKPKPKPKPKPTSDSDNPY
jgi:uncharacterized protein (TIGR02266 family)